MISGNNRVTVRKATRNDLDDIKALADAHRHELGFVRRPALSAAIDRREVLVTQKCGVFVGFLEYHHRKDWQTTLYHVAVKSEFRRQGIGRALMDALESEAHAEGKRMILLKCAEVLPANRFYERFGCQWVEREKTKKRTLLVWQRLV